MTHKRIKILIIEDNRGDLLLLQDLLNQSLDNNFEVTNAVTLSDGIKLLRMRSFDIVLTDLGLPDSLGIETSRKIIELFPTVPLIVLSSLDDKKIALQSVEKGAQDYLVKGSIDSSALERSIRYAIERSNLKVNLETFHKREKLRLKALNEQLDAANKKVKKELDIARTVQDGLSPKELPRIKGLEIRASISQARELGGDYFDIIPVNDYETAFLVADVSGHDIAAAFIVGMAKISFTAHIPVESSISNIFQCVNDDMCRVIKTYHHLTAFLAILNSHSGVLRYASAGHMNQILYRKESGKLEMLSTEGMIIGQIEDCEFEEKSCRVKAEDKLILFTDGLFENKNPGGEMYGLERFKELISRQGECGAEILYQDMLSDQKTFFENMPPNDDTCLIVCGIKENIHYLRIKNALSGKPPVISPIYLHEREKANTGISELLSILENYGYPDGLIQHYKEIFHLMSSAFRSGGRFSSSSLTAYTRINEKNFRIILIVGDNIEENIDFFTTGPGGKVLAQFKTSFGKLDITESGQRLGFSYEKIEKSSGISEVKFTEKNGEMYITVPVNHTDPAGIDSIRNKLIAKRVVNADLGLINQELENKTGKPVKIGRAFRYYDTAKDALLSIKANPLQAGITLNKNNMKLPALNRVDLEYVLQKNGIVYGIDHAALEMLLSESETGREYIVARGESPINGIDARIEQCVEICPTGAPLVRQDGSVDHKVLDLLRSIDENTLIMKKIAATTGSPGTSVFGKTINPVPGRDISLPAGENTVISGTGDRLLSKTGGYLYRDSSGVHVRRLFKINGNVDYSTGNIRFGGDVYITGNVLSSFKVEAGGNIWIDGETEAAHITAHNGNIEFKGGVLGKNKCVISCKGSVKAGFIQGAKINCGKSLIIQEHLLHVNADVGGSVLVGDRNKGVILGGSIICGGKYLRTWEIGNIKNIETQIRMPIKINHELKNRIIQARKRKKDLSNSFISLKNQLEARGKLLRQTQSESKNQQISQMESRMKQYYFIKKQMEKVTNILTGLIEKEKREITMSAISVFKTVFPNTKITFGAYKLDVASKLGASEFCLIDKEIKVKSLITPDNT